MCYKVDGSCQTLTWAGISPGEPGLGRQLRNKGDAPRPWVPPQKGQPHWRWHLLHSSLRSQSTGIRSTHRAAQSPTPLSEPNLPRVHPNTHVEHLCISKGASDPTREGRSTPCRACNGRLTGINT